MMCLDCLPVQEYFKSVKLQNLGHPVYTMHFPGAAVCSKSRVLTSISALGCCCRACYLCQTGQASLVQAGQTKTSPLSLSI